MLCFDQGWRMKNDKENKSIWEGLYSRGSSLTRYPFEEVVRFVFQSFGRGKPSLSPPRILDYGCGGGNHLVFLAREGMEWYGVDYSPSALDHARRFLAENGFDCPEGRLFCVDFNQLPFADFFFDAVIDRQSLDQNPAASMPRLVSEIRRVLKPGGRYLGVNFSSGHPQLKWGKPLGGGDYGDFTRGSFKDVGQRHFFTPEELTALFSSFVIEEMTLLKRIPLDKASLGNEQIVFKARKTGSSKTN